MKRKTKLFLAGAAVAGIYSAVKGKGPFNGIRFREQHERIANYVETNYPNALYLPITETENGWATTIIRVGMPKIILYITKDEDGNYIFTESVVNEQ